MPSSVNTIEKESIIASTHRIVGYNQKQPKLSIKYSNKQLLKTIQRWLSTLSYWQKENILLLQLVCLSEGKSTLANFCAKDLYADLFQLASHTIPTVIERLNILLEDIKQSQKKNIKQSLLDKKWNKIYKKEIVVIENQLKRLKIKLLKKVIDNYPITIF